MQFSPTLASALTTTRGITTVPQPILALGEITAEASINVALR
jgi:hypothetical protein